MFIYNKMSISKINDWNSGPATFGGDVEVENLNITGDLIVNGSIDGVHAQGVDDNNTWSGVQDFDTYRPTVNDGVSVVAGSTSAVSVAQMKQILKDGDVLQQASNTWSGDNDFSQDVSLSGNPTSATEGTRWKYVKNNIEEFEDPNDANSIYQLNNTWTGTVTFNDDCPLIPDPTSNDEFTTRKYLLDEVENVASFTPKSVSKIETASAYSITQAQSYLSTNSRHFICQQIAGGGGGGQGSNGVKGGTGALGSYGSWVCYWDGSTTFEMDIKQGTAGNSTGGGDGGDGGVSEWKGYITDVEYTNNDQNSAGKITFGGGGGGKSSDNGGGGGDASTINIDNTNWGLSAGLGGLLSIETGAGGIKQSTSTKLNKYVIGATGSSAGKYYGSGGAGGNNAIGSNGGYGLFNLTVLST